MAAVMFMGFVSGLPLALTSSTLQAWMVTEGVDLAVIGLFSFVGMPYAFKFLWSPLMDRYAPPALSFLGRRRGWMLATQILLVASISAMAFSSPSQSPSLLALLAMMLAFASASQDIVIDAYRVEILEKNELGAGAGVAIMGYRVAMLFSGAFALFLADHISWRAVYLIMAATMAIGAAITFFAPKPLNELPPPQSLKEAVVEPFKEYFSRVGAIEMLIFMIIYKLDVALTLAMNTPFFLNLGFTKTDIAAVTKLFGMIAVIGGTLIGGALMVRMTMKSALLWFGLAQALSGLTFTALAHYGKNYSLMVAVVFTENFCSGLGNAAFTAFMMSLTNKKFTATQYALLGSFMALSRYMAGAPSGFLAKSLDWEGYFILCTLIGIPGLLMVIFRYDKWTAAANHSKS
jgi:PAT family beta-lactamase induction signal transducer AmpG